MSQFEKGNNRGNRFPKGQSGNPNGRPKTAVLSDAIRKELAETDDLREIVSKVIQKAKGGDLEAVKILFDRLEGKPRQFVDADLSVEIFDWKTAIRDYGITEEELLQEAVKLLTDGNDTESISE